MNEPTPRTPHVSVRTTLVLLLSLLCSLAAGWLTFAATGSLPVAVLAGGGTFPVAWGFWDGVIS
ncbi:MULTISPECIES: hypothetical protein [Actinosynnema]|uniref:hypothetical protein n=1 Tax=Actinosynnema TaxID=40566 RepID=UPI0020A5CFEC|nr:hypothetical protein [Actinosynnema pretiosum]MCP2097384.1 hypothetical protein [Actinosynnema pretiosum]